ncbi:MAG: hypothetical protein JXB39_15345, partial [Deltaproteobacteria bacterium]|nr:hypothetical protein [Deltaproteobacteria bacterium]
MSPFCLRLLGIPFVLSGLPMAGCDDATDDTSPPVDDTWDTGPDAFDYDDADEDTIMDIHEGDLDDDHDEDGTPNYLDEDSD